MLDFADSAEPSYYASLPGLLFFQSRAPRDYALGAVSYLLCSKQCQHIVEGPNPGEGCVAWM